MSSQKQTGDKDTPTKPAAKANIDLSPLDGLRGICSVLIVIGHFSTTWTPPIDSGRHFPAFTPDFLSGVTLFFVISGYTLVHVYDRHEPGKPSSTPLDSSAEKRSFFLKRVARLAPLYYLGLLVGLVPLIAYKSTREVLFNIFFSSIALQSIVLTANQMNGPLWTVSAFVMCYWLFPRTVRWFRAESYTTLRNYAILCNLGLVAIFFLFYNLMPMKLMVAHLFGPFRILAFFIGVLAGYMSKHLKATNYKMFDCTIIAEAITLLHVGIMAYSLNMGFTQQGFRQWMRFGLIVEFFIPMVEAYWIIALTSPACTGITRPFLSSRFLKFFGDISYSLYCLHYPLFNWIAWVVEGKGFTMEAVPPYQRQETFRPGFYYFEPEALVPVLLVILVISTVAHKVLEAPARVAITKRS